MSDYATVKHFVNHVMGEIAKRDVEQVSERLRALGWEEVVRCRDCKFRCLDECTRIDEGFKDYWFAIEPEGFCKWGERE